ncbi:MAG: helix-turn-helix domain-containing protein [Lentisphaeraceae bacterium]|nr:helix-turn-helix domain-containing protein [Lentisphaeraceae bacterium]
MNKIPAHINRTVSEILSPYISLSPTQLDTLLCQNPQIEDKLLTLKQVSELLQVSQRHLYNLEAQGSLKFIRIGRAVRVRESALNLYLDEVA